MVMALYDGTLTNLIEIYEDSTGPHPDTAPLAPVQPHPKRHFYLRSQPVYVWFCFRNHPDIARERVWRQRWDALTPQQQAEIRIQRWGTPHPHTATHPEIAIVQPA